MSQIQAPDVFPGPSVSSLSHIGNKGSVDMQASGTRRRRNSSNLPEDPHGDTGAASLSTLARPPQSGSASSKSSKTSTSTADKQPRRSKRRKVKSFFKRWKSLCLKNTWLIPLQLMSPILLLYLLNPRPSNPIHYMLFLSYPLSPKDPLAPLHRPAHPRYPQHPTHYGKGVLDFAFVAFYMLVLSFTREFLMQRLIRPLAIRGGIASRAKQARFMEQAYTAIYFAVFGPYGLYVMSRTPVWYFNTAAMFQDFPHRSHEGLFKAYYLLQASYWAQQAVVLLLQLEKPRKDFKELVLHHVVTLALIGLSYRFHFTYMGLAVYITHDVSDFFLATSKCLNYLSHPLVGPYFILFSTVWAYGRHYQNLRILLATLTQFRSVGPFELNWETQQYKCWISQYITFALLACLQGVNIFWFYLILRIAKNYVVDKGLEDERSVGGSDDEGAEGQEAESTEEKRRRMGVETPAEARGLHGAEAASLPRTDRMNGAPREQGPTHKQADEPPMSERKRSLRRRA